MEKVIVTRHPALVDYLIEIGLVEPGAEVASQATADLVRGKHVIGVLPLHLAAEADRITAITILVPAALRGEELSLDQVREFATTPATYVVTKE
jgi:putative CRISPR-associated protein (TIGR02620 family)